MAHPAQVEPLDLPGHPEIADHQARLVRQEIVDHPEPQGIADHLVPLERQELAVLLDLVENLVLLGPADLVASLDLLDLLDHLEFQVLLGLAVVAELVVLLVLVVAAVLAEPTELPELPVLQDQVSIIYRTLYQHLHKTMVIDGTIHQLDWN